MRRTKNGALVFVRCMFENIDKSKAVKAKLRLQKPVGWVTTTSKTAIRVTQSKGTAYQVQSLSWLTARVHAFVRLNATV
eukprot:m.214178 g.214178  ORF g.214178 m.214178 type:complete len:79 (-) comp15098_c0_seq1:2646-2882(-)